MFFFTYYLEGSLHLVIVGTICNLIFYLWYKIKAPAITFEMESYPTSNFQNYTYNKCFSKLVWIIVAWWWGTLILACSKNLSLHPMLIGVLIVPILALKVSKLILVDFSILYEASIDKALQRSFILWNKKWNPRSMFNTQNKFMRVMWFEFRFLQKSTSSLTMQDWRPYLAPYTLSTHIFYQRLYKVVVSICVSDLLPCPMIASFCIFWFTYSCTCLEIFLRVQSMKVYDLAKYKWFLFIKRK